MTISYHQRRLVTESVQSETDPLHSYTEMTGNSIILNTGERMAVSHSPWTSVILQWLACNEIIFFFSKDTSCRRQLRPASRRLAGRGVFSM